MRVLLLVALAAFGCKDRSKNKKDGTDPAIAAREQSVVGLKGLVLSPALTAVALPEGSAPLDLKFAWQAPCTVPAMATLAHKDGFDEATFDLELIASKTGFEAKIDKLEVVGREKVSRTASEGRLAVARTFVLPPSLISAEGAYLGPLNAEAFASEYLNFKFSINPKLVREKDLLPNKAVLVQNGARKQWDAWISNWLGHTWVPGKVAETQEDVPSAMGALPSVVKRTHLGQVTGRPDLYLLEMKSESRGLVVETQIMNETKELLEARGQKHDELPKDLLQGYKNERTTKIAVDAKLRPYRVRQEEVITTKAGRVVKVLDTMFQWDKAKGCGK
jgi:hypothetical protein